MADKIINFTIPEAQVSRVIDGMKDSFLIPLVPDPNWVDPKDGSTAPLVNEFTDDEWVEEAIKRCIIGQVYRYEKDAAIEAINVTKDNTLIN